MTKTKEPAEQRIQDDVKRLREWLDMQPHLPHTVDDSFLRSFVVGTKTLEIAKQKLDAWFSFKNRSPNLFSIDRRDPFSQAMKDSCESINLFLLPKMTPEGYIVQWTKKGKNFDLFNHLQYTIRLLMQLELAMRLFPENKGLITIFDVGNVPGTTLLSKISPAAGGAGTQWFVVAAPLKLKKAWVVNTISVAETIVNLTVKPFMKEKLFKRISFSSECEKVLIESIPIEMLPEDYGGSEKHSDLLNEEWQKKLEENASWLIDNCKMVSDESKRPADKANTYGIEGTFRTLAID